MVGASREMVSRVMKDLEDRGMIETQENGSVVIKERLHAELTRTLSARLNSRSGAIARRGRACRIGHNRGHDVSARIAGLDDGGIRARRRAPAAAPRWRTKLALVWRRRRSGCCWLLALVDARRRATPAFSTSGSGDAAAQQGRPARRLAVRPGASSCSATRSGGCCWSARAPGWRRWRAGCAATRSSDAHGGGRDARAWLFWVGLALLLAASAALEWTRLYRCEARLPAATPAACSATLLGPLCDEAGSASPARACSGSPRSSPASSLALRFSWLRVAERIGARHRVAARARRRAHRARRGPAPRRAGACASASTCVEVEHELHRATTLPIVIEPTAGRGAEERARRQGAAEAAVHASCADTKLPQVDLLDARAGAPGDGDARDARDDLAPDREEAQGLRRRGARRAASPGPVITRYEIEPAIGVKGSQVVNLAKDLARSLSPGVASAWSRRFPARTTWRSSCPTPSGRRSASPRSSARRSTTTPPRS